MLWKTSTQLEWMRDSITFSTTKIYKQSDSSIWVPDGKNENGRFRYLYSHEHNTLLGKFQLLCTMDDLVKLEKLRSKKLTLLTCVQQKKNELKLEIWKNDKSNCFCCFTLRRTYGLQGRCLTQSSAKKLLSQLSHVWRSYKTGLYGLLVPSSCFCLLHLHGNQRLAEENSKTFNLLINRMDGFSANQFRGVHFKDTPVDEGPLILNDMLCDLDIVDGNIIGELARQSVHFFDSTVKLLRYKTIYQCQQD